MTGGIALIETYVETEKAQAWKQTKTGLSAIDNNALHH